MREQSRIGRNAKPPSISVASYRAFRKTLMNQSAVTSFPVTDRVNQALEVTLRGVDELLPKDEWIQKLAQSEATGVPLRIKLGLDPTAPDIHLGHTVVLNKMRQLQDLGHQVIFLIGDFTTLIGDPSGRNSTRPPLTAEQIKVNAETYYTQAAKVLDPVVKFLGRHDPRRITPRPPRCWTRPRPKFVTTASGATSWALAA